MLHVALRRWTATTVRAANWLHTDFSPVVQQFGSSWLGGGPPSERKMEQLSGVLIKTGSWEFWILELHLPFQGAVSSKYLKLQFSVKHILAQLCSSLVALDLAVVHFLWVTWNNYDFVGIVNTRAPLAVERDIEFISVPLCSSLGALDLAAIHLLRATWNNYKVFW